MGRELPQPSVSTGEVMKEPDLELELSPVGVSARDSFCREMGAFRFKSGAYHLQERDEICCLAPALLVSKPMVIVGIGDAMTASAFYSELKALER
jgi:ADP-dependent phosphofructokinase/glucokinase